MKHIVFVMTLSVLVLAAGRGEAQTGGNGAKPLRPGSVRITTRAPEADKWIATKSANGAKRTFKCKPLACAEPQIVSFTFSKSPTRKPDPKALEKFAKVDLPKSIRAASAAREVYSDGAEKIEILASETAKLKNYPAVLSESKISRGKKSSYLEIAIIFAGPVMIRVHSSSTSQKLAKGALAEFIETMRIEEGPALDPQPRKPGQPSGATRSL
jgi:hypothetical protein